jgi:hypothetical protein
MKKPPPLDGGFFCSHLLQRLWAFVKEIKNYFPGNKYLINDLADFRVIIRTHGSVS